MKFTKIIRKKVYGWHRITSLLAALPVLLWSISGFMYPVMGSFKPEVKNQTLPAPVIETGMINLSLQEALQKNGIDSICAFRIISWDQKYYYQLKLTPESIPVYINCSNGELVEHGDLQYASYLAGLYLSGPSTQGHKNRAHPHAAAAEIISVLPAVMPDKKTASTPAIKSVELVRSFTDEYKKSNRFLPVYRVEFDRPDHIRLYIETTNGLMAAAIDDRKAWFTSFFSWTHSWSFLDGWGQAKSIILGLVSLLCFLSSLAGFYVYTISNTKKQTAGKNPRRFAHRLTGNIFAATTLLYAISGAWHSFNKLAPQPDTGINSGVWFRAVELKADLKQACAREANNGRITSISLIKMAGKNYWQIEYSGKDKRYKKYLDLDSMTEMKDGETRYAGYLASIFSKQPENSVKEITVLSHYTNKYSMMNRRLPVVEVNFKKGPSYYIETSTGQLAGVAGEGSRLERFSFSNLHLHHYWEDWLGKNEGKTVRKYFLLASTLGLLLLVLTGLLIYFTRRFKKRRSWNLL